MKALLVEVEIRKEKDIYCICSDAMNHIGSYTFSMQQMFPISVGPSKLGTHSVEREMDTKYIRVFICALVPLRWFGLLDVM